jgi:hypothetical protein
MNTTKIINYHYKDETGNTRQIKSRTTENKSFFWTHVNENREEVPGRGNNKRLLYLLPELLKGITQGQPVFLVEGEKDADTLTKLGLTATTTGTSLEWEEEYEQLLANANTIILYDNDKTGIKRRDLLCARLFGHVKSLRVVDLPGIEYRDKHGEDVSDWLEKPGKSVELLLNIVEQTPDYRPTVESKQKTQTGYRTVSVHELLLLDLPPREMLLSPFLPSQGLVLLVAKTGIGKTHVALGIAYAVASGGTFFNWTAPNRKNVLYIDGEMPAVLMKERLFMISTMSSLKPTQESLRLLTPDLQGQPMPDLSCQEGRGVIEPLLKNIDLVILDNISCLFRSGSENEAESWQEAQEWALDLRRRGISVLFVHHAGKNGVQRGTSKREDVLDTVIILKHSDDYKPEEGARFEVEFTKARHFSGADARSFQAVLKNDGENKWWWELSDAPEDEELVQIAAMKNNDCTIKQIVEGTKLSKSQVEYRLNKAKEKNLITKP